MATQNMQELNGKELKLMQEMEKAKVDVTGITEAKKRGDGKERIKDYIFLYSRITGRGGAGAGVGLLLWLEIYK